MLHTTCAACMRAACGNDGVGAGGLAVASPGAGVQIRVIPTRTWIICKLFPRYVFFAQPSFFQGNTPFLGLVAVDMAAFGTECDDKRWWLAPRSSAPAMVVCVVFLSPLVCAA